MPKRSAPSSASTSSSTTTPPFKRQRGKQPSESVADDDDDTVSLASTSLTGSEESTSLEARKLARKERNRLSAASSRQRKREEDDSLRSRLEEATTRLDILARENAVLRSENERLAAENATSQRMQLELDGMKDRFVGLERAMLAMTRQVQLAAAPTTAAAPSQPSVSHQQQSLHISPLLLPALHTPSTTAHADHSPTPSLSFASSTATSETAYPGAGTTGGSGDGCDASDSTSEAIRATIGHAPTFDEDFELFEGSGHEQPEAASTHSGTDGEQQEDLQSIFDEFLLPIPAAAPVDVEPATTAAPFSSTSGIAEPALEAPVELGGYPEHLLINDSESDEHQPSTSEQAEIDSILSSFSFTFGGAGEYTTSAPAPASGDGDECVNDMFFGMSIDALLAGPGSGGIAA